MELWTLSAKTDFVSFAEGHLRRQFFAQGLVACVELGSRLRSVPLLAAYPLGYGSLVQKTWIWPASVQEGDCGIFLDTEQAHLHCEEDEGRG